MEAGSAASPPGYQNPLTEACCLTREAFRGAGWEGGAETCSFLAMKTNLGIENKSMCEVNYKHMACLLLRTTLRIGMASCLRSRAVYPVDICLS